MKSRALRSLRALFSANGAETGGAKAAPTETRYYSASELASIKRHRTAARAKAREAVKAARVTIDPRIAKARLARG